MKLLHGNNIDHLKTLEDNSIDSLVTDPPYLINFMGKDWDKENSPAGDEDFWKEVLRVMKPGAHGVVFGHSRQHHRVMTALEDAGFEIRDCLMWLYAVGFPKSHNIGKAIEKLSGEVKVIGKKKGAGTTGSSYISNKEEYAGGDKGVFKKEYDEIEITNNWEGWGTALKPAYEPIILVRKPLEKKLTVAKNVLKWGTGGINIDASRIGTDKVMTNGKGNKFVDNLPHGQRTGEAVKGVFIENEGRFPANVLLSHHPECKQVGERTETYSINKLEEWSGFGEKERPAYVSEKQKTNVPVYECVDGCAVKTLDEQQKEASRFFYCAKVSKKERNAGCENLEEKLWKHPGLSGSVAEDGVSNKNGQGTVRGKSKNDHPTVKPIALMSYLVKLITPPGGVVLDPFMGSGSTGCACVQEGFDFVGMEMDADYVEISKARIEHYTPKEEE